MSEQIIQVGDVAVKVIRKETLKNVYLRIIPPHADVTLSAPAYIPEQDLTHFLLEKLPEIYKRQQQILTQPRQSERTYISGEAHYLWGKPYRLQVNHDGRRTAVTKRPGKLILTVPESYDSHQREKVLTEWYRSELRRVLGSAAQRCQRHTGITANEFRIKQMKTRWGTCNISDRRIWLNLQLVKKPPQCLDYVIIHELVHLLEPNHTNRFYELVGSFCPTWREADRTLRELPLDHISEEDIRVGDRLA